MKTYRIDCSRLLEREPAHDHLAAALELPEWYGRNLDALYDCITSMGPGVIHLEGADALARTDGYGWRILLAITDAVRDNPDLTLEYGDGPTAGQP